ncbi:hypothetical protein PR202_ga24100 [Eleusine coracana subsp. coracana]|uniref:Uncharacterized protein n=1 Tax=Eleusine coracana subsp. coracana TaxID=191504 RepID=A0AAV5D7I2_ELECO|nr:hypothetical protein PR202_ga24100 [Eleusine coracana subsp. coracana]
MRLCMLLSQLISVQQASLWTNFPTVNTLICSVKATIERYKKANSDTSNTGTVAEVNAQHYQQESAKLRQTISSLQNSNR